MKEGGGKIYSNDEENKSEKNDSKTTQKEIKQIIVLQSCS